MADSYPESTDEMTGSSVPCETNLRQQCQPDEEKNWERQFLALLTPALMGDPFPRVTDQRQIVPVPLLDHQAPVINVAYFGRRHPCPSLPREFLPHPPAEQSVIDVCRQRGAAAGIGHDNRTQFVLV